LYITVTIVYKYLAPGATSDNDKPITTTTKTVNSEEVLDIHPEGEIITLQADDPEEYGEGPKKYKVQYRFGPRMIRFGDNVSRSFPALLIVVSDPEA